MNSAYKEKYKIKHCKNRDIRGSIWTVRNDRLNIPFLDIELSEKLTKATKARNILTTGINSKNIMPI